MNKLRNKKDDLVVSTKNKKTLETKVTKTKYSEPSVRAANKILKKYISTNDFDDEDDSNENDELDKTQGDTKKVVNVKNNNNSVDFDWDSIYSSATKVTNLKDEGFSYSKNRALQDLVNKTLNINSKTLYYRDIPASRGLDYKLLAFFDKGDVIDFVTGKTDQWYLVKPQVDLEDLKIKQIPEALEPFTTKTERESFENDEIEIDEMSTIIIKNIDKKFKSIKALVRKSEEYQRQTGNWLLHIGWPFVEGRLEDGRAVRTPLMWFSVSIKETINGYCIERIGEDFRINTSLIIGTYSIERLFPKDLNTTHRSFEAIFQEYARHNIRFNSVSNPLRPLQPLSKEEFEKTLLTPLKELKLANYLCLENRDPSGDVFNDLTRIVRDFKNVSLPKPNKKFFNNEEDILAPSLLYDVDLVKAKAVELALEDSTVIWGPPGTGKSEAITIILAQAIANGKRALLVAEKDAALSVVVKRLDNKFGLAPFVLKINGDTLTNKNAFYSNLRSLVSAIHEKTKNPNDVDARNYVEEVSGGYEQILTRLHDMNISPSDFWHILDWAESAITALPQIRLFSFVKDFDKLFYENTELVKQEEIRQNRLAQAEKESLELEEKAELAQKFLIKANQSRASALNEFVEKLSPPVAYLPQDKKTIKFVLSFGDNKELFRAMNEGRYNIFNFNKGFRTHQAEILKIVDKAKAITELENDDNYPKNEKLIVDSKAELANIQSEIKTLKLKKIVVNNMPTLLKLNSEIEDFKRERVATVIEILRDWQKILGDSENYQTAVEQAKNKMRELYDWHAKVNRNKVINLIRKKLEADHKLAKDFRGLTVYVNNEKRRPIPATLFKEHFQLFSVLFPVMIATPSEVSKYMPNDPNIFDYGVFDEASQIYFHIALPSIHRCRSIVIAGDDKQLNPDSFFATEFEADEEIIDLSQAEKDADSLLVWGKTMFRETMLTNHYRSTHFKLIEFSNVHYYGGHLLSLSRPDALSQPIMIEQINGAWEKKINYEEAKAAIALALEYWAKNYSVGIVTFNFQQKELITDLIDEDRKVSKAFNESKDSFVRNIVNVQGDEADVIIFSLAYAPSSNGTLRLGGLSHITPNVLNVAITRSKKKMIVLRSFELSQLGPGTKHTGRNELYNWLKWVEDNSVEITNEKAHVNKFRSPFEEEFFNLLELVVPKSIKVLANYYTNGYEIDLVLWNRSTNSYEAAIELDGRMYHSRPEQKAIDDDKTRFLESVGWKVIRVSSLEFYRNKENAVQRLAQRLGYLPKVEKKVNSK